MALWDSGPDAPTPPNPTATAAAQTGTNVSTAIANSYLGNINQITPQGSLTNTVTDTYSFTDPFTGQSFNIPRWTAEQTLNPTAQATFNQNQQAQSNLAGMGNEQSASLRNLLGTPFNPGIGTPGTWNATEYMRANPDVANYARTHGAETQENFNARAYLAANPDVAAAGVDPWTHWNAYGRNEGREFTEYVGADPAAFAAQHFRDFGQGEGRSGLFGGTGPAPAMGDINLFNQVQGPQSQIDPTTGFQFGYGSGGDITRDYGPADNFSADRQRVEQSMFERVNPQIQQQEDRLRQQLADQGIRYGSQAYSGAYDPFNRQVTDTRLGIVAAGGAEQQRMNQMAQQRAQFQNAAQQQAEQQAAARSGFWNQAAQSQFDQAAARGQFYNQAQNQMLGLQSAKFNAANQLRNQALQEGYQLRSQPINEIAALLSGSQVQQPNFINAQRTSIPTTDVAGLINQNFAQQNDIFKTQTGSFNDIVGGLLGAGGQIGRGLVSDVRVKENIAPMGSIMSPHGKELPIYEYDYKGKFDDGQRHVGPMAQDVEKLDPKAVKTIGGVKHIDRDKLGSIFGSV